MEIPKQPTLAHSILAENIKLQKLRWFTLSAFKNIPNMYDAGQSVPRQGWVQIDPKKFEEPSEAQEAAKAKAAKEAQEAAKAKAAKEAQEAAKAKAAVGVADVKSPFESMKVPEILEYIKANNIEIEGVENLPKSEIIKLLNSKTDANLG